MKFACTLAILAGTATSSTTLANDPVSFCFRSRTPGVQVINDEIVLSNNFTGVLQLALIGRVNDPTAYSLGGFGGAIGSSLPITRSQLTIREMTNLPIDLPSGNDGMLFPFRTLFQGGDGNDLAPENQPPSLVGFDSVISGTPSVGRYSFNGDTDPRVGFGDDDLYFFEVTITPTFQQDLLTFTSYTGPNNINQLIYDLGGGVYNYRVVDSKSCDLVIRRVPTPGALALLGLGGLVAARRRRA